MKIYRDEEPVTKELKQYRKKMLYMLAILPTILSIPIFFYLDYSKAPENPLLGIRGLYEALRNAGILLYVSFISVFSITTVATWFNLRRSNLKHAITGKVNKGMGVDAKYFDPLNTNMTKFCRADDQKLVQIDVLTFKGMVFPIIVTLIPISIFLFHIWTNKVTIYDGMWIAFSVLLILYLIYNFSFPRRRIEFNRLEGTVTVPAFALPFHRTLKFDKVQVNAYTKRFQMAIPYRYLALTLIGEYAQAQEWWSFYMWYMDKNRPLPNGSLLDPYREKDYLRRKAEGFPAPLYPATIDTPEWKEAEEKYGDKEAVNRYRIDKE
ncbi:MAG: hypothetical protein E6772_18145 [Dysgonomonas sp.]|nr:hypothetical protein [Dysgonomonas sp.]